MPKIDWANKKERLSFQYEYYRFEKFWLLHKTCSRKPVEKYTIKNLCHFIQRKKQTEENLLCNFMKETKPANFKPSAQIVMDQTKKMQIIVLIF